MKSKKIDLRIVKTKKSLYEALVNLMSKKSFESIKVIEICNEALVDRSTFYSHFEDKYALLDSLLKDMKESLLERIHANDNGNAFSKENLIRLFSVFIDEFQDNKKLYTSLIVNNRNGIAIDMLESVIKEEVLNNLEKSNIDTKGIPLKLVRDYYIGAFLGVMSGYFSDNESFSKDELLDYLYKLLPDFA